MDYQSLLSSRLAKLTPYVPGEQPQDKSYIKLNTNENPYPPCPGIKQYLAALDYTDFRLYPDNQSLKLRTRLANFHDLDIENIFVGNGSDEVLSFAFYAFFDPRNFVLFPEYTYSFYPVYSIFYDINFKTVELNNNFSIDLRNFVSKERCGVIFPNPNAPTGMALSLNNINDYLLKTPWPVIIDEAYIDFGAQSAIKLINKYPNLLIVRTLSKSAALAGLRLGYALGSKSLIKALETVKDSFNSYTVNRVTQKCSEIAIIEWEYYETLIKKIIETREDFSLFLKNKGWKILPSKANFVFASFPDKSGPEIYKLLKENGILVRHFNKPGIENFLRITIGSNEQMTALKEVITKEL